MQYCLYPCTTRDNSIPLTRTNLTRRQCLPWVTERGLSDISESLDVTIATWRARLTFCLTGYLPLGGEGAYWARSRVAGAIGAKMANRASVIPSESEVIGLIHLINVKAIPLVHVFVQCICSQHNSISQYIPSPRSELEDKANNTTLYIIIGGHCIEVHRSSHLL